MNRQVSAPIYAPNRRGTPMVRISRECVEPGHIESPAPNTGDSYNQLRNSSLSRQAYASLLFVVSCRPHTFQHQNTPVQAEQQNHQTQLRRQPRPCLSVERMPKLAQEHAIGVGRINSTIFIGVPNYKCSRKAFKAVSPLYIFAISNFPHSLTFQDVRPGRAILCLIPLNPSPKLVA